MKKKIAIGLLSISTLVVAGNKIVDYNCYFPQYATDLGVKKEKNFNLNFKIDIQSGKSFMEGNNGLADVVLTYNEKSNSVTFTEVTSGKNVMTTTIVPSGKAVHSRNTVMLGDIVPS